jgi:hypothetical protein
MQHLKAYILFPGAARNPLYAGWLDELPLPARIVRHYDTQWTPPADAGIVITHHHYRWEELAILRRILEADRVPVLILVDGILEYRNCFENPDLAEGCMFQPLMGHKLACLGDSQIRWIESWGNAGRCELVGLPRLDDLIGVSVRPLPASGPFRLLVASARTPWFNDEQRELTFRAVGAVKSWLDQRNAVEGRSLEVVWRMAEPLHLNLQVPGFQRRPEPLPEVLQQVHAVVTTPSTLQLEAAARGLPVAVLDFHNYPPMTPLAWSITHESQVTDVLTGLASPPPARMLAQEVLLADALQFREPASQRMHRLVEVMVQQGREARQHGRPLQFPDRILAHPTHGFAATQPHGTRQTLFPDHPVFQNRSLENLQTELAAAIHEMGEYPAKYFQQRSANQKLRSYIHWLRLLIRNRADRIEELSAALQLSPEQPDRPVTGG